MGFNNIMAAYSLDLRQRIIDAVERGELAKREIAKLFGVHESFIYKLLRQRRDRGDIAPLPHGGGAEAKLQAHHLASLAELVAQTPDATLDELRERLQKQSRVEASITTIWRGLESLNLSRKKSLSGRQQPTRTNVPSSRENKKGSR